MCAIVAIHVIFLYRGLTEESATRAVIEEQLPAVARSIRLGEISVDNIDVFCEKDVFEVENSRKILQAGRVMGLRLNFHADELNPIGGAEVKSVSLQRIHHQRYKKTEAERESHK